MFLICYIVCLYQGTHLVKSSVSQMYNVNYIYRHAKTFLGMASSLARPQ